MLFSADQTAGTLQAAEGGGAGGSNMIFLLLAVVFVVVFMILPMRRQKKARTELQERQNAMGPGTPVMTQFGLYGTIVSVDQENKTAILEVAPGTQVKVHLQTVTTVLDENGRVPGTPEAARAAAEAGAQDEPVVETPREGTTINGEAIDGTAVEGDAARTRPEDGQDGIDRPGTTR